MRIDLLKQGHHSCFFYDDQEEAVSVTADFLSVGLQRKEQCMFLADPRAVAAVRARLTDYGVDVHREMMRGALILTSSRGHLNNGFFDARQMIRFAERAIEAALANGFSGFRGVGDAIWEQGMDIDFQKFEEYETLLDRQLKGKKITALCLYDRKKILAADLCKAFHSHNAVIVDDTISTHNRFYEAKNAVSQTADFHALRDAVLQDEKKSNSD